jgi:phosphoribosylamine--glycine ligase
MPPGIPVATVSIGKPGAVNAGILALQILATSDVTLQAKLLEYKKQLASQVEEKAIKIESQH